MEHTSIKKNYIYNLVYELFMLIVPIAVTPYVARVLGEDASGQYSYIYSIVTYFTLFAALGFTRYAQRVIASHQGDKYKQSVDFWNIFIARLIPVNVSLIIYFVLWKHGVFGEKYAQLVLILSINIFAVGIDISYLFQGNEDFKIIVIRNIIIKSIGFGCIFFFVKGQDDLWIYALIQSLIVFFSNLSLWIYLPKYTTKIKKNDLDPFVHLPFAFILFIPTIATSVYTVLDKILIGIITKCDAENGNYEYSEKLVKMALTVITSLGAVMLPRNSLYFAKGKIEKVKDNLYSALRFVFLIGCPLMFGLIAIAPTFMPFYLGAGYDKSVLLVQLLSPLIVIIGISNVIGTQWLIPSGQDKKFTISITVGAIANFGFNIVFISIWSSYGAALASVIAEILIVLLMLIYSKSMLRMKTIIIQVWRYIVAGTLMFGLCFLICNVLTPFISTTFILLLTISIGVAGYLFFLWILHEKYVFVQIHNIINTIRRQKNV